MEKLGGICMNCLERYYKTPGREHYCSEFCEYKHTKPIKELKKKVVFFEKWGFDYEK